MMKNFECVVCAPGRYLACDPLAVLDEAGARAFREASGLPTRGADPIVAAVRCFDPVTKKFFSSAVWAGRIGGLPAVAFEASGKGAFPATGRHGEDLAIALQSGIFALLPGKLASSAPAGAIWIEVRRRPLKIVRESGVIRFGGISLLC